LFYNSVSYILKLKLNKYAPSQRFRKKYTVGAASRLMTLLFIELTPLCVLATYFLIDLQSTVVLLAFNALFISLLLQLKGNLPIKLGLLAAGNLIGMIWNYCFHQLIVYATDSLMVSNSTLSIFYTVAYPFLNSLWVISFWSLSLAILHNYSNYTRTLQLAN